MNTIKNTISELLSNRVLHSAPLFQRRYVWKREENWEPFWDTVREVADRYALGQSVSPRFLGAIVLEQLNTPSGHILTNQIIDGQQRLTTLQILLAAARDFYVQRCENMGWPKQLEQPLVNLTSNYLPVVSPEEKFKVWPTNADREHFERVMTARSPANLGIAYGAPSTWQEPKTKPQTYTLGISSDPQVQRALDLWDGWSEEERGLERKALSAAQLTELRRHHTKYEVVNHLMAHAYWYFWSSLAIWLETDVQAEFDQKMQAFLNAIQMGLVLVVIKLDAGEDAQMIFETMNARGLPLSASDLVKNFVFREADRTHKANPTNADPEALYNQYWRSFDDDGTWWRAEVRQGRLVRPRMDTFLWNYLTLTTRKEVLAADLFISYRNWAVSQSTLSPEDQIVRFARYARIFREFESDQQPERVQSFIKRLALLDVSTIYPLLLELFDRHRLQNVDLDTILADLESWLMRRLLVGLTSKNYNRFFFDLLQKLEQASDFSPATVRAFLLAAKGDSTRWPDDDELKKSFLSRPLYGWIKAERLAHVLQALDKQMHTVKGESYTITSKLSIEHLMPQKWQANWPLPASAAGDEEAASEARENLVHTIGNLTLVTTELNSALSNSAWSSKQAEIQKHSGIIFNRSLPAQWDEAAIKKRSSELYDLAVAIWPYPATP